MGLIGDFLQELKGSPLSTSEVKTRLKECRERINALFDARQDVSPLIEAHTQLVDELLRSLWCWHLADHQDALTLIAVGGYGRAELHPHSDVDLLILLPDTRDADVETRVGAFITDLWDIGLDIGHSVRSFSECLNEAKEDISVITNLMESRWLAGRAASHQQLMDVLFEQSGWSTRDFFNAKLEEQQHRYKKFHDTAYRLEPNIKEGRGGLRDIQTISWVTQRHFGHNQLLALHDHGFITEAELETLREGRSLLWRIRFALHVAAKRKEDRLLFHHQKDLALLFGYRGEGNEPVEQFMQQYYRQVMELERLNDMLLQLFREAILENDSNAQCVEVSPHFRLKNRHLELQHPKVFEQDPAALFEIFLICAQNPDIDGLTADTIRRVRESLPLIDEHFRQSQRVKALFIELLKQPEGVTRQLRRMNRYGVLAAYWPAFERIVGRMQYDLFHVYTVDEHTLMVVRNLRRFSLARFAHELPLAHEVFHGVDKPELLYLMGLFHDIGKGQGGDHSTLGAEEAERFCRAHGLSIVDTRMVVWAVQNHLLMSNTAQQRDIADYSVIQDFAQKVGSRRYLNYLYLLTAADIRGTNMELWNSWKDSLLRMLFLAASELLKRGIDNPLDKRELVEEKQYNAEHLLLEHSVPSEAIATVWRDLGDDYFLRHTEDEISWHTRALLKHHDRHQPLVLMRKDTHWGATEIFVYTQDHDSLFAHLTAALQQQRLNILNARIVTSSSGHALDTFLVLDQDNSKLDTVERRRGIRLALEKCMASQAYPKKLNQRTPQRLQAFHIPAEISFDNEIAPGFTSIMINATDRPGVLSHIGRCFDDQDISVHSAQIATFGEKIEDVFLITDRDGHPLTDQTQLDALEQHLVEQLDNYD